MSSKEVINNNLLMGENDDIIRKIEKYIKCPRCKNNLRCYRRKILSLDRKDCKNVCDHCLNEYLFHKATKYREIDKKAIGKESSPVKYNKDKVKLWLSRIIDLLESNLILYKTANLSKQAEQRALSTTESRYKAYKKNLHEPDFAQMFDSTRNIIAQTKQKPGIKIKSTKRGISYLDGEHFSEEVQDMIRTKIEKVSDDVVTTISSSDDVTMSSTDSRLREPFLLQDKLQVLKKVMLEDSPQQSSPKHREKLQRIMTAKRPTLVDTQKDYRREKLPQVDSESRIDSLKRRSSSPSIKRFNSLESLAKSISEIPERTLEQNFSYFFPKEVSRKQPLKRHKSSSEIIKETIDMLSERAEFERKKKEEEMKRKLEEDEKKRLARIEKMKKKAEAQKQILELTEEKKEVTYVAEDKVELESIKSKSVKSAKIKPKVTKTEKHSSKAQDKPSKEELKKERKERLAMEKEKKNKEKQEREERLRLEKEQKMKEKAEKEERLRQERDKKLLEKEEKERLKKEKLDQLQAEKAGRQKQMELKEKVSKPKEESIKESRGEEKKNAEKAADKPMKELTELKLKEEAIPKIAADLVSPKTDDKDKPKPKKEEKSTFKELSITKVKLRKPSQDNLILQLVKLKQSEKNDDRIRKRPTRLSDINISPLQFKVHQEHKLLGSDHCLLCKDSELELDVDNIIFGEKKRGQQKDAIMGQKIVKITKSSQTDDTINDNMFEPLLFKSTFTEEPSSKTDEGVNKDNESKIKDNESKRSPVGIKRVEQEPAKGIIRYALSDRSFIEKGWTMLPTEKVVRKMNVYRMRPAHPEFDWFEHNKNKKIMFYDSGEKLAEFDDDGKGRWFYRNGRIALDFYDAEEINAQQRFVIYSNGEPDERGRARPFTILATFDYLGNGVVFDHSGKIRLKYNQTEGVVLDKNIGPVSHWKWHTLNDPPVLQQVMIDTQMAHKDPDILKLGGHGDDKPRHDNEEMLAIEFDNFIKEKSKKLTQKFKPFQIKMKALKINENFSLKVLDQATVYLIFRDGSTNLKLNIGMILDHKEIVDTDTAEVGEVSNSLERFPAKTDSLAGLQHSVAHAQRVERARVERERRLRPSQSCASTDKLTAAASRPLRPPFRTTTSNASTTTRECCCQCRRSATRNIYYDTRLV